MSISINTSPQLNTYYKPQAANIANNANTASAAPAASKSSEVKDKGDPNYVCQTCKQRRYQDESNDPGVSFKTPGYISPGSSAAVVAGHEQEHVTREQAKASSEGRRVVSQSVVLHYAVCPECHRSYVSGGTTRTVTASDNKKSSQSGNLLDMRV